MGEKTIHIYYINKIKDLDYKIFEYEDDDAEYVNWRAVKLCERNIEKWLNKANITDKALRQEIREVCVWSRDLCATLLESKGWKILYGKENLK